VNSSPPVIIIKQNSLSQKEIMPAERNLRIGNCSGATGDAPHAMARMVREADVDVITGDW